MCCSGSYACEYRHKVKHGCFNFLVDKEEEEERGAGEESCGSSPQKYVLQNLEKIKNKAKWYLKYICTWVWMGNLD